MTSDAGRACAVLNEVLDGPFAVPYGTRGAHADEASHAPDRYWRGSGWPQLDYRFWLVATRRGFAHAAGRLRDRARGIACRSRFSEYYDPKTGDGLGQAPQAWAFSTVAMRDS